MILCARSHDTGANTVLELSEQLNEYGYNGVQLVPHKTFKAGNQLLGIPNLIEATMIGQVLNQNNKKVVLVGAYFNPVHYNALKVQEGIEQFRQYIDLCVCMGCNVVGSETGSYNGDKWTYNPLNRTKTALNIVVDTFSDLCIYGINKGVNVAIEGASGHVCWNIDVLNEVYKMIVDRLEHNNLKIIFDLYNMLDNGNAEQHLKIAERAIKLFGDKIICWHIKDCFYKNGTIEQVHVGGGQLALKEYLKMIKDYDKSANLVLEGVVGDKIKPSIDFVNLAWDK